MHLFFIDFFKYSLEVSAGAIIFSVCVQRKENFWRRCAGVAALCAAVSLILSVSAAWMDMGDYGIVSGCTYAVLTLLSLVFVWICLKGSIWNLLFCTFAGTMLRMCAKKIFDIVLAFWEMSGGDIGLLQKGTPLRYVVYYAIPTLLAGGLTVFALWREGREAEGVITWLTPTEGERAMGLPDGWTAFGHDGRPVSARARQKALGNSIALPCAEYIMAGVKEELEGGKQDSDI